MSNNHNNNKVKKKKSLNIKKVINGGRDDDMDDFDEPIIPLMPEDWPVQSNDPFRDNMIEQQSLPIGKAIQACSGCDITFTKSAASTSNNQNPTRFLAILPGILSINSNSTSSATANASNSTTNGEKASISLDNEVKDQPMKDDKNYSDEESVAATDTERDDDVPQPINSSQLEINTDLQASAPKLVKAAASSTKSIIGRMDGIMTDNPTLTLPLSMLPNSDSLKLEGQRVQTTSKFLLLTLQPSYNNKRKKSKVICRSVFNEVFVFGEGIILKNNSSSLISTTDDTSISELRHLGGSGRTVDGGGLSESLKKKISISQSYISNDSVNKQKSEKKIEDDESDHSDELSDKDEEKINSSVDENDDDDDDSSAEYKEKISEELLGSRQSSSRASRSSGPVKYKDEDENIDNSDEESIDDDDEKTDDKAVQKPKVAMKAKPAISTKIKPAITTKTKIDFGGKKKGKPKVDDSDKKILPKSASSSLKAKSIQKSVQRILSIDSDADDDQNEISISKQRSNPKNVASANKIVRSKNKSEVENDDSSESETCPMSGGVDDKPVDLDSKTKNQKIASVDLNTSTGARRSSRHTSPIDSAAKREVEVIDLLDSPIKSIDKTIADEQLLKRKKASIVDTKINKNDPSDAKSKSTRTEVVTRRSNRLVKEVVELSTDESEVGSTKVVSISKVPSESAMTQIDKRKLTNVDDTDSDDEIISSKRSRVSKSLVKQSSKDEGERKEKSNKSSTLDSEQKMPDTIINDDKDEFSLENSAIQSQSSEGRSSRSRHVENKISLNLPKSITKKVTESKKIESPSITDRTLKVIENTPPSKQTNDATSTISRQKRRRASPKTKRIDIDVEDDEFAFLA